MDCLGLKKFYSPRHRVVKAQGYPLHFTLYMKSLNIFKNCIFAFVLFFSPCI